MTTPEHDAHIPIKVWIKTLVLSCILFWGGYLALDLRDRAIESTLRDDALTRNDQHIYTNCIDGQKPDVMVIGSSLVRNAMCSGNLFKTAFSKTSGDPVTYEITVKPHGILEDFTDNIPRILSMKPRWLFMETNMVCVDMTGRKRPGALAVSLKTYTRELLLIARIVIRHPVKAFSFISSPIALSKDELKDMNWVTYSKYAAKFGVRPLENDPEWKAFFTRAAKEGIIVCLLDLPRSKEAANCLPKGFSHKLDRLLETYDSELGVRHILFPRTLDQKTFYLDAAHFNNKGSQIYCEWFANLLSQPFTGEPH